MFILFPIFKRISIETNSQQVLCLNNIITTLDILADCSFCVYPNSGRKFECKHPERCSQATEALGETSCCTTGFRFFMRVLHVFLLVFMYFPRVFHVFFACMCVFKVNNVSWRTMRFADHSRIYARRLCCEILLNLYNVKAHLFWSLQNNARAKFSKRYIIQIRVNSMRDDWLKNLFAHFSGKNFCTT